MSIQSNFPGSGGGTDLSTSVSFLYIDGNGTINSYSYQVGIGTAITEYDEYRSCGVYEINYSNYQTYSGVLPFVVIPLVDGIRFNNRTNGYQMQKNKTYICKAIFSSNKRYIGLYDSADPDTLLGETSAGQSSTQLPANGYKNLCYFYLNYT